VTAPRTRKHRKPTAEQLEELIEEATVDAYNPSEQMSGFHAVLEQRVELPFKTEVLGVEVTVEKIDLTDDEQIVAVCSRGRTRQRIPLLDLPLPERPPAGVEWIHAFRRWARQAEGAEG
jgi:hypothetical protein